MNSNTGITILYRYADSGWQYQNAHKILQSVTIPGSITQKDCDQQVFLKFRYENIIKMKHEPDSPDYKLHIYPMKSKKDNKISFDYPFKMHNLPFVKRTAH
jgi:hypothetical protein